MSNGEKFLRSIPNFDLDFDGGDTVTHKIDRDGVIGWEAYTSRKMMSFELMNEGFRVTAQDLGLGMIYDGQGELSALRVNVVHFLYGLIKVHDEDVDDTNNIGLAIDLLTDLETLDHTFIAHVDIKEKLCCLISADLKTGDQMVLSNNKNINFDTPAVLLMEFEGINFGLILHYFEGNFGVGLGISDPDGDPNEIGSLPNDIEEGEVEATILTCVLASDCNYMTFLDSKKPDRFERLAKRIILR